jgi:hypothetical protein
MGYVKKFKTNTGKNACATCGTGILACVVLKSNE